MAACRKAVMAFVFSTVAFVLGLIIAFSSAEPARIGCWIALGLALVFLLRRRWALAGLVGCLALGVWVGVSSWRGAMQDRGLPQNLPLDVVGTIKTGPVAVPVSPGERGSEAKAPGWRLVVQVDTAGGARAHGVVAVRFDGPEPGVLPGDRVSFRSRLFRPRGYLNPGIPDAGLASAARGIDWIGALERPHQLHRISGPSWTDWPWRSMHRLRGMLARVIEGYLPATYASFLRVMVLGERTSTDPEVELGFRAAGATHALSVSGLHLAVVCGMVFFLFTRIFSYLPGAGLWFSPRSWAAAFSIPLIWLYTILTGEAVATVRSAWMATYLLVGLVIVRASCLSASLCVAALILLMGNPLLVLDVSFQLSFLSVVALGMFIQNSGEQGNTSTPQKVWRWFVRSLWASTVACLMTAPLVAFHFAQFSPAAPIGNLALVPILELIVLPCALFGSLLGLAHPWLGFLPMWLAEQGTWIALWIAGEFRQYAPIWNLPSPTQIETALCLVGVSLCLWGRPTQWLPRNRILQLGGVCLLIGAGLLVGRMAGRFYRTEVNVTLLDVGQGESILVEGPGAFVALVDGGGQYDGSFDVGERVVVPALNAQAIRTIDLVVLTHPHPDHINGLFAVFRTFRVNRFWTNGDGAGNPRWGELLSLARERGATVEPPRPYRHAGLSILPLGPWVGDAIQAPEGMDANNASLVLQLEFAGRKVLLTGDIGEDAEFELMGRSMASGGLRSDILKVPHHGSRHSSSVDFIAAVRPALGILSAGSFNRFSLPNPVTLVRYADAKVPLVRTDRSGAVTIRIEKNGLLSATCVLGCR